MTEQQFQEYQEVNSELDEIQRFLCSCGNEMRYKWHAFRCSFRIGFNKKKLVLQKKDSVTDWMFYPSEELQSRIVNCIEEYTKEKKKYMESI